MMTVWLVMAAVTVATLAILVVPLLRGRRGADDPQRAAYDLAVYRDQLVEADRDFERGLLSADQRESIRLEIQRRMIAVGKADPSARTIGRGTRAALAAALAVAVPALSVGLYLHLGEPRLPDVPYSEAQNRLQEPASDQQHAVVEMVEGLAAKLRSNPNDVEGWQLLGRSYRQMNRLEDAIAALREAVRRGSRDAETHASLGESITLQGGGTVTIEAADAFRMALRLHPGDPRGRFYLGMERRQAGDAMTAIAIWRDLEKDSAQDAPWLAFLKDRISETAQALKIDPKTVAPRPPEVGPALVAAPGAGPVTASAPAAAPPMTGGGAPDAAMIRSMVARLDARLRENPNDPDGWARLAQSYRVLGDLAKAKEAYGRASALKPNDLQLKLDYADVLFLAAGEPELLPADYVRVMREILAMSPDNQDAQYYVGLAEAQGGRYAEARALWSRLLGQLSPASAEHQAIREQLDALPKG